MRNSRRSTTRGMWVYHDPRWRSVRHAALRRDGWKCVNCGVSVRERGSSRVDHIKLVEVRPDLAFSLDNLRTLCVKCDAARHWLDRGGSGRAVTDAGGVGAVGDFGKDFGVNRGGKGAEILGIDSETGEKWPIDEDGWPVPD